MPRIPTHIITGFLGSGKTTFLKELLSKNSRDGIALVMNELGEIALDQKLIQTDFIREKTLFLNAGCACCNKREDLKEKFRELLNFHEKKGNKLQRVLVETTGLANPAPIIFTFLTDPFLSNHFEISNIFTCVDALEGLKHLENKEAQNQILSSDCIILTKSDLGSNLEQLYERISELSPGIKILQKQEVDFKLLSETQSTQSNISYKSAQTHSNDISSLSMSFSENLDWNIFGIWLSMLLYEHGNNILRIKGLIRTNEDYLTSINGVGHLIYRPTHTKISSKDQESSLVFITKNLPIEKIEHSLRVFSGLGKNNTKFTVLKNRL